MPRAQVLTLLRVAVTCALIGALVAWAGPREVLAAASRLDPLHWALAAAVLVATTTIGGLNLHLILSRHSGQPFLRFLRVYWTGWAVGLVTPGQVGDVATVSVLLGREGVDWRGTLGRLLLDKLITLGVMALVAAFALAELFEVSAPHWRWPLAQIGGAAAVILAAALFFARHSLAQRWRGHAREIAIGFAHTLRHHPGLVALNATLSFAKLLLTGAAYWLVFTGLGASGADFWRVVGLSTASGLLAYLPISVNGIGPVEAAATALFGLAAVPVEVVVPAYLVLRLTVLLVAWVPAAAFFSAAKMNQG